MSIRATVFVSDHTLTAVERYEAARAAFQAAETDRTHPAFLDDSHPVRTEYLRACEALAVYLAVAVTLAHEEHKASQHDAPTVPSMRAANDLGAA